MQIGKKKNQSVLAQVGWKFKKEQLDNNNKWKLAKKTL